MTHRQPTFASINIRAAVPADSKACARICFEAFSGIAAQHNFPCDFSIETAKGLMNMLLSHPRFFGVVAEIDGEIVGSNFLDERSPIAGIGPITIDPKVQNRGVGRRLMEAVLDRGRERAYAGIRLVQAAYHMRSLALYSTLGFQVREPLGCMQGAPISASVAGYHVRQAREADLEACNRVCTFVHGHHRSGEVLEIYRLFHEISMR